MGKFVSGKTKLIDLLKRCKKILKRKGKIYLDLPTIDAIQSMHSHGEWEFDQTFSRITFYLTPLRSR